MSGTVSRSRGISKAVRRGGFTLIELLVVIAILALLLSLLMPSLQKANEVAKAAVCLSNQKQCGTAFATYANDWDRRTVVMWQNSGGGDALWPSLYSGEPETFSGLKGQKAYLPAGSGIFGCPSNRAYQNDLSHGYYGRTNYGYGMYSNALYPIPTDHQQSKGWNFSEVIKFAPPGTVPMPYCELHVMFRIPRPADIVWLADTSSTRNWEGGNPAAQGRMVAAFHPTTSSFHTSRIQLVHYTERANVLFYDGHAAPMDMLSLYDSASNIRALYDKDRNFIDLP